MTTTLFILCHTHGGAENAGMENVGADSTEKNAGVD